MNEYTTNYEKFVEKFQSLIDTIRSGRPHPSALNEVYVKDSNNKKIRITNIASVSVDNNSYIINVWDKQYINSIQKAIVEYDTSFNPQLNGQSIRINMPIPSGERRKALIQQVDKYYEEIKKYIRLQRTDDNKHIEKKKLSEDEERREKNELQKCINKISERIDQLSLNKKKSLEL